MRVKLYRAPTIGAAMSKVRAELGPDALILSTRGVDGGVELTAAMESAADIVEPLPDPARVEAMAWHGVPRRLTAGLIAGPLLAGLQATFRFAALPLCKDDSPVLIAGPPGAGKTLTVARLATRLVLAGLRPMVITADGKRAGAAEQLAAFTRLLGLTLIAADEPLPLARALARRHDGTPVLIDAPGLNPADPNDRAVLDGLMSASGATQVLVVPSGLDPAEAHDVSQAFSAAGARLLIATRLDQSRRLGGILAAAANGLALSEAGIGPGAADGLCPLTPEFLAARLATAGPLTASRSEAA